MIEISSIRNNSRVYFSKMLNNKNLNIFHCQQLIDTSRLLTMERMNDSSRTWHLKIFPEESLKNTLWAPLRTAVVVRSLCNLHAEECRFSNDHGRSVVIVVRVGHIETIIEIIYYSKFYKHKYQLFPLIYSVGNWCELLWEHYDNFV